MDYSALRVRRGFLGTGQSEAAAVLAAAKAPLAAAVQNVAYKFSLHSARSPP